jgi:hypothetical protein
MEETLMNTPKMYRIEFTVNGRPDYWERFAANPLAALNSALTALSREFPAEHCEVVSVAEVL